ncbi:MAG: TonB-dependent receptor domain-containing protein [Bacteroidota bacterium]
MKYLLIIFTTSLITTSLWAQTVSVSVSGSIKDKKSLIEIPFANIVVKKKDSTFVTGTISDEEGHFILPKINNGDYFLEVSLVGYKTQITPLFVGTLSSYLDMGNIFIEESVEELQEVVVSSEQTLGRKMDKKVYTIENNVSQIGGSILQSMQNLPGVTVQDGLVSLRGNSNVVVLMDGKQSAITGFGDQKGLENIPVSTVDRIEIINNPTAEYDANGNAGIINIILRKETEKGFNGRVGITGGAGALWIRKQNLPDIRPQYHFTPKINPSVSLNYRNQKANFFLQADNLYTETLNKNEFITRTYDDGTVINQQLKRNRDTNYFTSRAGLDYSIDENNDFTISGFFSRESIMDRGDEPFFNEDLSTRNRLWEFLEDEVLTSIIGSAEYQHRFKSPGHLIDIQLNYSFNREDEKYFFDNILPGATYNESFYLIADQHVIDLTADYAKPLKFGMLKTGLKFRRRTIPTDMQFNPSTNSPLDPDADGEATYAENIPATYVDYTFNKNSIEAEVGMRLEYVNLKYEVDPNHNTYKSDGYDYFQPFPNIRITKTLNSRNKLSLFYNRRVDRPDEVDIRIFPKYDDAEIIKVGNPGLKPQFTNAFEFGYKYIWGSGELYTAAYYKESDGTITRISTTVPGSTLIYTVFQNIGLSSNVGLELVFNQDVSDVLSLSVNANGYFNQIEAYEVTNQYPTTTTFNFERQSMTSGNIKVNSLFKFSSSLEAQLSAVYLAPDLIPQGRIDYRFSLDLGVRKFIQQGNGELFFNATDLLNTMIIHKEIEGNNFVYTTDDYYETQVVRIGYSYKF